MDPEEDKARGESPVSVTLTLRMDPDLWTVSAQSVHLVLLAESSRGQIRGHCSTGGGGKESQRKGSHLL